jgi:hypothetical protein
MDPQHCGAGSAVETDRSVDSSRMGQPETRHHAQRRKMATPTEFEVAAWGQVALTVLQIRQQLWKHTEICEGTGQLIKIKCFTLLADFIADFNLGVDPTIESCFYFLYPHSPHPFISKHFRKQ